MAADHEPLATEQCNCFATRRAARRITRLYDAHLQPTGLSITQFLILATLNAVERAGINELAERLDTERTAMGKMVGFLERDGVVSVAPSPTDGRSRIVGLTESGQRLFEQAEPLWRAAQNQFARMNGEETARKLRQDLAELVVDEAIVAA